MKDTRGLRWYWQDQSVWASHSLRSHLHLFSSPEDVNVWEVVQNSIEHDLDVVIHGYPPC